MVGGASSAKPGANSRGRGGKFRKFTRGGGKHFSRDLKPLDADGNEISMWSADAQKQFAEDEEDEEEDSDEEESDGAGPSKAPAQQQELTREERKKAKKAQKDAAVARKKAGLVSVGDLPPSSSEESDDDDEDDMPANPNHSAAARKQAAAAVAKPRGETADVDSAEEGVKGLAIGGPGAGASRRERESYEAQQAKERYQKLHEQGKTDEAKADMARLKLIREKREAEAARKQVEKEERESQEAAKKAEIDAKEAKKRDAALGPAGKKKVSKGSKA